MKHPPKHVENYRVPKMDPPDDYDDGISLVDLGLIVVFLVICFLAVLALILS